MKELYAWIEQISDMLHRDDIDDVIEFASIDVSFISLTKVLLPVRELLTDDGEIVCLNKASV